MEEFITQNPNLMLLLTAIGAFLARDIIPWLRSLVDSEFKYRRERMSKEIDAREERFLKAFEMSATAQAQQAQASIDVAASLQIISQTRVADNMTLVRIERRLDEIRPTQRRRPEAEEEEDTA